MRKWVLTEETMKKNACLVKKWKQIIQATNAMISRKQRQEPSENKKIKTGQALAKLPFGGEGQILKLLDQKKRISTQNPESDDESGIKN